MVIGFPDAVKERERERERINNINISFITTVNFSQIELRDDLLRKLERFQM